MGTEHTGLVGRPRTFNTPEEMELKAEEYFKKTPRDEITLTGLILHLNIAKDTFYQYAERPEYNDIIKKIQLRVENEYEISLRKYGRTGDIFALKNFGWKDKQEVENSGTQNVVITMQGDVSEWGK